MLEKIIGFSIHNKLIIGIFTLVLLVWGGYSVTQLPIDAVPDITDNQVQVITVTPSLGAPDVERLITFPIEQANSNIPGLKKIRSFSRFGLSLVTIVFDDDVDIYWARQQVNERLQQVQTEIPAGMGVPSLAPVTTGLGEIYQYVVKTKPGYQHKYSVTDLRTIQDWVVRRQLLGTKGVADVSSFGGLLKQYEVAVNPGKLKSMNVTMNEVFNALESNNQNTGGAYIEKGPTVLYIRSEGLAGTISDIENMVVKTTPSGMPVMIRDVGTVQIGAATRYGAMCYNNEGEVAGAVVMMLKGENSSKVIKEVKEKIAQIQKSLPEGIVIEPFLDRTKMVNNAISTVETNLMEGALIVLFVLVFFLANIRAGLLVASLIPLSMLFAVVMMNFFGVGGNLMSLGAIDFGLIVDGAVIIVEAVMHQLTHSKLFLHTSQITQKEMDEEVHHSSSRIMNSAVFGQIIILIVYLPILSLSGIEGKMFKPMAQTVSFAILGAFILSLTYVPMMSALFLSKKIKHKKTISDRLMIKLEKGYQHLLERVLNFPKTVVATALLIFIASILLMSTLGGEFIPELEEGDFAVDTRVLTGSSLTTTIASTQQAANILLTQFPEVQKVVTKIGSGEIPTDPMPMEAADMMVILKPKKEWTSAKTFDELAEKMGKAVEDVPGITTGFQFPVQMRFNELMTGARQDVVCKIFGEDLDTLAAYAEKLGAVIAPVEGAKDLYVEPVTGMPQIVVNYHRAAIAKFGLNINDINRTLNAAFAGQAAGLIYEGEKHFDLVVRVQNNLRKDISDVRNLLIATASGVQVPLNQLAEVSIVNGPNQIQREDTRRRIIVGFNVRGRDVQSVVEELQKKVETQMKMPAGYYVTYGGSFENLTEAKQRLEIALPVALLLIFLLLYFAFNSIGEGLLIFSAIPLSAVGGIVALWLRDMSFSISAGIGFIALFGVAVLNGIVLIAEFNRLRKEGVKDVRRIVIQGTKIRLRSVLMTALAPSLGFIPMAFSTGAGAEVQRPLATVVIGGIVSATLLTLLVLPVLYVAFMKLKAKREAKGHPNDVHLNIPSIALGLLVLGLGVSSIANSQNTISLQQAIDSSLKQNLSVQTSLLKTKSAKKLEGSAWDIPFTNASFEYGQMNSLLNDNRFGISQSISFPLVYVRQKQVYASQTESNALNEKLIRHNLQKQITAVYYEMLLLQERKKLLQQADSFFFAFLQKQEQRFAVGDANILEKTAAESQRMQVANQLEQWKADYTSLQLYLSRLMNTNILYDPENIPIKMEIISLSDTSSVSNLPYLKWKKQEEEIALKEWQLSRARLSPQLSIGYNNQSIRGGMDVNGTEVFYSGSKRFSSVIAGLNIPLFFNAAHARNASSKINYDMAKNDYADALQTQQTEWQQLLISIEKNRQQLQYFESGALKQSKILTDNAALQFNNGAISYLEWLMLVHQAIGIQSDYLNAIGEWNRNIIELQSYSNN